MVPIYVKVWMCVRIIKGIGIRIPFDCVLVDDHDLLGLLWLKGIQTNQRMGIDVDNIHDGFDAMLVVEVGPR